MDLKDGFYFSNCSLSENRKVKFKQSSKLNDIGLTNKREGRESVNIYINKLNSINKRRMGKIESVWMRN